jgi:hypothetical protein
VLSLSNHLLPFFLPKLDFSSHAALLVYHPIDSSYLYKMSAAQNIPSRNRDGAPAVTNSFDPSTSPTATFTSPSSSFSHRAAAQSASAKQLKPFNTQDVKVLLLENINVTGQDILRQQGYQVEALKGSIPEDELIQKIRYADPSPSTLHLLFTNHTLPSTGTSTSSGSAQRQS